MPIILSPLQGGVGIGSPLVTNAAASMSTAVLVGATYALRANEARANQVYRLWCSWTFTHTAAATPLIQCALNVLGQALSPSFSMTPVATAGTFVGELEAIATFRTIGATASVFASLVCRSFGLTVANAWGGGAAVPVAAAATVNSALAGPLALQMNMVTAVAGNSLSITQGTAERVYG